MNELEIVMKLIFHCYRKISNSVDNLRKEKLRGTFIHFRAKWVDEGEKPTN